MMPMVGEEFAGYRLLSVLGRGGMSVVFQAENPRIGSSVALKVLAPELSTDDVFRARFLQESRIAASLNHPNVIPIYDMGAHGDLLYIAMRYVPGSDLKQILRRGRALSPVQVLHIIDQAARALDHAHRAGLVHRDVKPANILVQRGSDDDPDHVYLADFGISKHALSRTGLTPTGQFMGTIDYIAPEQITGRDVDGQADIYSLGCVLYESLTGRVPFVKEADAAVIWAHVEEAPTPPSQLRPELGHAIDDVMSRALAKNPADRYTSGRELVEAARTALGAKDVRPETALSATAPAGYAGPPTEAAAPREWSAPGGSSGGAPPSTGSGAADVPPPGGTGAGPVTDARRRRAGWLVPVTMVVLAALALGGLWYGYEHRSSPAGASSDTGGQPGPSGSTSPSGDGSAGAGTNPIMGILAETSSEGAAQGYVPPESCQPATSTKVVCAPQVHGADLATFETYDSLSELYSAYLDRVEKLTGERPSMDQTAVGNCSRRRSSGEVSWNHRYEHPRNFMISQLEAGGLSSEVAGGRLFCTLVGGRQVIVWTHNDLKLLGQVTGYGGHAETFLWWRTVHHNMGPGMSMPGGGESASPGESESSDMSGM
ncbi:protein kinase domain-containing protein [Nocardioides sp. MAHUQ-72]|uniref:serine/threonine-protein kinase n=1 Tax=unclassified Nocardioides TaxID=2615069 RepID=UPI00360E1FFE